MGAEDSESQRHRHRQGLRGSVLDVAGGNSGGNFGSCRCRTSLLLIERSTPIILFALELLNGRQCCARCIQEDASDRERIIAPWVAVWQLAQLVSEAHRVLGVLGRNKTKKDAHARAEKAPLVCAAKRTAG